MGKSLSGSSWLSRANHFSAVIVTVQMNKEANECRVRQNVCFRQLLEF